ncbi:MAG: VanZ family protein [Bacteroidales bacterium]|nr:VanZ family protein [Bacteroidales bacterium]
MAGFDWITRKFWPGAIWAVIILLLIGLPGDYFPNVVSFWDWLSPDKLVHFFVFGVFTFLMLWGYRAQYSNSKHRSKLVWLIIILGVLYGGLTEVLQTKVFVGREGSVFDFLANTIGSIIGIIIFMLFARKNKNENASFL